MDDSDPILTFFPGQESVDLYAVLNLKDDAKAEDIKKAYRRLALLHHPDKHAASSDSAKEAASTKFQQVGFAYAVLGDEKRRMRYGQTGKTDEGFDMGAGDDGWEAYFEDLFERVTRGRLDEMKKSYQGSAEELADLKAAYTTSDGALETIMTHIPHSTHDDESRFIVAISKAIADGELPSLPTWVSSSKDEKAKLVRKKQADKEAGEAERLARELGVWDEFYGNGKKGARRDKGKGKATAAAADEEEDTSALQALILKKKQKNMDGFFDSLAAKYAEPSVKTKGKKRSNAEADEDDEGDVPRKKRKGGAPPPPDIDDAEFEKLQKKLFGNREATKGNTTSSSKKTTRSKRTKS